MTTDAHRVTITWDDGTTDTVGVGPEETALEAAQREGLDPPYACEWGACARCIARLVDGEFEYADHPRILAKYGHDEFPRVSNDPDRTQYVLLCLAHPRSDCRVEIEPELYRELSAES